VSWGHLAEKREPSHSTARGEISSSAAPGTASGPAARAGPDGLKRGGASRSASASARFLPVNGDVLGSQHECRGGEKTCQDHSLGVNHEEKKGVYPSMKTGKDP
jgi:hypothetical protein